MDTADKDSKQVVVRRVAAPQKVRHAGGPAYERDSRQTANQIGKAILLGVVLLSIGIGLFFRFKTARFTNLVSLPAVEAADVARNFRMHRVLVTSITYPLGLSGSRPDAKGYDIGRPPLYPLALAAFFKTRGISDDAVIMFNALCMFALAWVLYRIMLLAFDRSIAVWSVLAYFGGVQIIGMTLTADGIMLTALLFSLAVLAALHALKAYSAPPPTATEQETPAPPRLPWLWLAGVGIMAGLAYLAGYFSPLLWLPLAAIATAGLGARRKPAMLLIIGIALFFGLLWWGRNMVTIGQPWSRLQASQLVMNTTEFPGVSVLGALSEAPGNPGLYLLSHPADAFKKVARGLTELYRSVPDLTNIYLFAFLIAGFIWLPKTPERRLLYAALLWTLGIQLLTSAFTNASDAPLGVVRPLATGLSVGAVILWLRSLQANRGLRFLAAAGVIAIAAVPYLASVAMGRPVRPGASVIRVAEFSKGLDLEQKSVILTDNPWIVAWYGPHRAILLPTQPQDLDTVMRLGRAPHLVYLTSEIIRGSRGPNDPWRKALENQEQTKKLGLPLPMGGELLTLTPLGAKELKPETVKRFNDARKNIAQSQSARSTNNTSAPAKNQ